MAVKSKHTRYIDLDAPDWFGTLAATHTAASPQANVANVVNVASAPLAGVAATPVSVLDPDDIEEIVGIGPMIGAKLRDMGITTFAQIAAWSADDAQRIGADLAFPGRIERENWIEQARELHSRTHGE